MGGIFCRGLTSRRLDSCMMSGLVKKSTEVRVRAVVLFIVSSFQCNLVLIVASSYTSVSNKTNECLHFCVYFCICNFINHSWLVLVPTQSQDLSECNRKLFCELFNFLSSCAASCMKIYIFLKKLKFLKFAYLLVLFLVWFFPFSFVFEQITAVIIKTYLNSNHLELNLYYVVSNFHSPCTRLFVVQLCGLLDFGHHLIPVIFWTDCWFWSIPVWLVKTGPKSNAVVFVICVSPHLCACGSIILGIFLTALVFLQYIDWIYQISSNTLFDCRRL